MPIHRFIVIYRFVLPHTHTHKPQNRNSRRCSAVLPATSLGAITTPVGPIVTNMLYHLESQTIEQRRIATTNLTMLYKISKLTILLQSRYIHRPTLPPGHVPPHVHTTSATCHTNVTHHHSMEFVAISHSICTHP